MLEADQGQDDVVADIRLDATDSGWSAPFEALNCASDRECSTGSWATADRRLVLVKCGDIAEFLVECMEPTALVRYRANRAALQEATFRHLLLDQVLPRVLAARGSCVLHGALLNLNGTGIGVIGATGSGKSTLSAALALSGGQLLSDDGFIASIDDRQVKARATYPSLRLWPDTIRALYAVPPPTSPVANGSTKRRVVDGAGIHGYVALGCIFVLNGQSCDSVAISRQSPATACMSLVANCFQLDTSDPQVARRTLGAMGHLIDRVPTYSLKYPRHFSELPKVCEAIRSLVNS